MTNTSSQPSQLFEEKETDLRTAKLEQHQEKPIGVCIYLSPTDLRLLGISTEEITSVTYRIDEEQQMIDLSGTTGESGGSE